MKTKAEYKAIYLGKPQKMLMEQLGRARQFISLAVDPESLEVQDMTNRKEALEELTA